MTANRWRARPWLARSCRVIVFVAPVVAVTVLAYAAAQLLPAGGNIVSVVGRWVLVAAIALAGAVVVERLFSRLLPIAALFELDIGFPFAAPTRLRVAWLASLRPRDASLEDLLPGTADHDVDAAAEHVLVSYATRARHGLQPRSHLERVRLLAMLVAARLGVEVEDRDRLQWALLLREIGSPVAGGKGFSNGLEAWLGPWAAMLHGPFIAVARSASAPQLITAAHAAAAADAYAVVTASHPYRRGLGAEHAGSRMKSLADHHLLPEAVDALLTLPDQRLRKAMGVTAAASPMVERLAPAPQPILAATSIVVVLALATGSGLRTARIDVDPPGQAAQEQANATMTPSPPPTHRPDPGTVVPERSADGRAERAGDGAESAGDADGSMSQMSVSGDGAERSDTAGDSSSSGSGSPSASRSRSPSGPNTSEPGSDPPAPTPSSRPPTADPTPPSSGGGGSGSEPPPDPGGGDGGGDGDGGDDGGTGGDDGGTGGDDGGTGGDDGGTGGDDGGTGGDDGDSETLLRLNTLGLRVDVP